jgi:hypothetical protein
MVCHANLGHSFTLGYPPGSNRLSDVTQGSSTVRSFTHDDAGNITHDDRAGTIYRYSTTIAAG